MVFDGVVSGVSIDQDLIAVLTKNRSYYGLSGEIATNRSFNDLGFNQLPFHAFMADLQYRLKYEMTQTEEKDLFSGGNGTLADVLKSAYFHLHHDDFEIPETIKIISPEAVKPEIIAEPMRTWSLGGIARRLWKPVA